MDLNLNLGSAEVNSQEEELRLLHSVAERIERDYPHPPAIPPLPPSMQMTSEIDDGSVTAYKIVLCFSM